MKGLSLVAAILFCLSSNCYAQQLSYSSDSLKTCFTDAGKYLLACQRTNTAAYAIQVIGIGVASVGYVSRNKSDRSVESPSEAIFIGAGIGLNVVGFFAHIIANGYLGRAGITFKNMGISKTGYLL